MLNIHGIYLVHSFVFNLFLEALLKVKWQNAIHILTQRMYEVFHFPNNLKTGLKKIDDMIAKLAVFT